METTALEVAVLDRLRALTPDQQQEVLDFASFLALKARPPLKSLYGILADRGIDISEQDIDDVRKEMWANFPREP